MKRPHRHLLHVDDHAETYAPLFEAAEREGLRVGWLTFDTQEPPPALASAAGLGALRAVAIGGGRTVAVKPMRGAPVLRDVLREHFRGCALVLVTGDVDGLTRLVPTASGWQVHAPDGAKVGAIRSADDLVAALRRPRPW